MARELPSQPFSRDALARLIIRDGVRINASVANRLHYDVGILLNDLHRSVVVGEWFDFGAFTGVPDHEVNPLKRFANDAIAACEAGFFRMPHPISIWRARFQSLQRKGIEVAMLVVDDGKHIRSMSGLVTGATTDSWEIEVVIQIPVDDQMAWKSLGNADLAQESATIWRGLWLMLNTGNLPRRVDEPSEKLIRARKRAGKLPPKRVTHIDAQEYITALVGGGNRPSLPQGGTHASPIAHVRRGHVHTLRNGVKKWFQPMWVAGSPESRLLRDKYRVPSAGQELPAVDPVGGEA